jgi:peroxiredoxin
VIECVSKLMVDDTAIKLSTNEWKGKKVVLFSVPGAVSRIYR